MPVYSALIPSHIFAGMELDVVGRIFRMPLSASFLPNKMKRIDAEDMTPMEFGWMLRIQLETGQPRQQLLIQNLDLNSRKM